MAWGLYLGNRGSRCSLSSKAVGTVIKQRQYLEVLKTHGNPCYARCSKQIGPVPKALWSGLWPSCSTVGGFSRSLWGRQSGSQPAADLTIPLFSHCSRLKAHAWLVLIILWRLRLLPSNWVTLVFKYFKHVNYFTEANKPTFWLSHLIRCFEWKPKCLLERLGKLLWNRRKVSLVKSKRLELFWFSMLRKPWSFTFKETILKHFR